MPDERIVEKSVEIAAPTDQVWHALTDSEIIAQWMAGAHVESKWEPGSEITFTGTMPNFNRKYRDRGTVIAAERGKILQYSYWSQMTRLPDTPQNRTIFTFRLEQVDDKTRLSMRHENFHSETEYKHSNFFWGVALYMLKSLLEANNSSYNQNTS